jgi:hypothetical protein
LPLVLRASQREANPLVVVREVRFAHSRLMLLHPHDFQRGQLSARSIVRRGAAKIG